MNNKKIGILLALFNGEKYLIDLLNSIANQDYQNWILFVSDDGSTDHSLRILLRFREYHKNNKIIIYDGPRQGFAKNYLSLIRRTKNLCDYYAFCDQDDIWHKNKLSRALCFLELQSNSAPSLYGSSTRYISEDGDFLMNSFIFQNPPCFENAIVQNISGGNTMVFNQFASNLIARTPINNKLAAHDWWTYILVSGFTGYIYYDPTPSVDYRQHTAALVGENRSIRAKFFRVRKVLDGQYKNWNTENLNMLNYFENELPLKNKKTLIAFRNMRSQILFVRLFSYFSSEIRRQKFFDNLALLIAVFLNKV